MRTVSRSSFGLTGRFGWGALAVWFTVVWLCVRARNSFDPPGRRFWGFQPSSQFALSDWLSSFCFLLMDDFPLRFAKFIGSGHLYLADAAISECTERAKTMTVSCPGNAPEGLRSARRFCGSQ
jgi:hypothetical protein